MKQGWSWKEGSEERRQPLRQPLHPPNTQQDGRGDLSQRQVHLGKGRHQCLQFTLPCPLSSPGGGNHALSPPWCGYWLDSTHGEHLLETGREEGRESKLR